MEPLLAYLDARCPTTGAARRLAIILAVTGLVLAGVGVAVASMPVLPVFLGALAGAVLFASGYVLISHGMTGSRGSALNLRRRWAVTRRRWAALWFLIAWLVLLFFAGSFVNSTVIIGALNVAVLLGVWHFGSRTPAERTFENLDLDSEALWIADEDTQETLAEDDAQGMLDEDEESRND